jgi:hypothetical protein
MPNRIFIPNVDPKTSESGPLTLAVTVELPSISLWRFGLLSIEKITDGVACTTIRADFIFGLPVSRISERTFSEVI